MICLVDDLRFYKGKYKVRVLSKSTGGVVVEALEAFDDMVSGDTVKVKRGEKRIVAANLLFEREELPPPIKEHTYELNMEKKLKHIVEKEEEKKKKA